MKSISRYVAVAAVVMCCRAVRAGTETPDYTIRARLRIPDGASWGAGESVGHARFRVQSRFLHVYYGGVSRNDEYKFDVSLDYTGASGFDVEFASSSYNADYDVYINDDYVGRVLMNAEEPGVGELKYDSRHPSPPELPLPAEFPELVNVGDMVRIFAAAPIEPSVGDPLPAGTPIFSSPIGEEFARGDVNQDGHVDSDDFDLFAASYDPYHLLGDHFGPMFGDFTNDNLADVADYDMMVQNWDSSQDIPSEPSPAFGACVTLTSPLAAAVCESDVASFSSTEDGAVPTGFVWSRGAVPIDLDDPRVGVTTSLDGRTSVLTISDLAVSDAGTYRCAAETSCGTHSSAAAALTVIVIGTGDGDNNGLTDGRDIRVFVSIVLGGDASATCGYDMNADGVVDIDDLAGLVQRLLD